MAVSPLSVLLVLVIGLISTACAASFPCSGPTYVDSYSSLPSAAVFPTTTLPSTQTPAVSSANPLTQNHWSEVAKYSSYRPAAFTPTANPTRTNCPYLQSGLKNWHDPATWGGSVPGNGATVTIPAGVKVLVSSCSINPSFVFSKIVVPATSQLILGDAQINIASKGFDVQGAFLVGSATCRLHNKVNITLYGTRSAQSLPAASYVKGLAVTGTVDIHGMQYFPTWTRLAMTAKVGDKIIFVQDIVNWQAGQTIFITSTELKDSRDWHRNELFTIAKVYKTTLGTNVAAIELDHAVQYAHFGGREYQAEVGLISRNIVIQGDATSSEPTDTTTPVCTDTSGGTKSTFPCDNQYLTGFGGHVQVIGSAAQGRFSGVELYRMGQTNVLGRYPLHWHMVNQTDNTKNFATDCSVYHSFFRCYTIHGTHGVLLSQNTAYDAIGNCFYLSEAGVEENSTIKHNLAAFVHPIGPIQNPSLGANGDSWWSQYLSYYQEKTTLINPADMSAAPFYITNMYNTIEGNAASGGWTGFSFPGLPAPIQEYKAVNNMNPANRPFKTPFRGNTAHSTGFWWASAGAFYFGGELKYTDSTMTLLTYTAGRSRTHDTCSDPTAGTPSGDGGCWDVNEKLWVDFEDNKAFLTNRGLQHWGERSNIVRFEIHDAVLSMNVFGDVWINQLLMNCRSTNLPTWFAGCPNAPPQTNSPPWGACNVRDFYFFQTMGGFQWYDVYQKHIMTNSTFRNCRADWPHCIYGPSAGTCGSTAVFTSLTHSDQFVPQLMQATKGLKFENCGQTWRFTTKKDAPAGVTVSGRLQSWLDVDGTATGTHVRTMIGSTWAGGWWNLTNCPAKDENFYCRLAPKDGAASILFRVNPSLESGIGSVRCMNGNSDGSKPCPVIGKATHFGRAESTGLDIAVNAQITGAVPYKSGGWFVRFTAGTPNTIVIDNIQVDPTVPLVLAFPYPSGTSFDIYFQAADWCATSWAVCTHKFTAVSSIGAVFNSSGDVYFWNNAQKILYVRPTMQPATFGAPGTDKPWTSIPTPLRFTRDGITINTISADSTLVIKATNCATNPCAAQPSVGVPTFINPTYAGLEGAPTGAAPSVASSDNNSEDLSTGAIVDIVIGSSVGGFLAAVFIVALIAIVVVVVYHRRRAATFEAAVSSATAYSLMNDDEDSEQL